MNKSIPLRALPILAAALALPVAPAVAQSPGFRAAAAITKQLSPVNAGDNAIVELNTLATMPYQLMFHSLTTPQGVAFKGVKMESTCPDAHDAKKCRQYFTMAIDAHSSGKCKLDGDYVANFHVACLSGDGGCKPGKHEVAFSLKSENFCTEALANTAGLWQRRAGNLFAADVGVGGGDVMWLLDAKKSVAGGFDVITLGFDKAAAMRRSAGAARIDVDAQGGAFIAKDNGEMFHFASNAWNKLPGLAKDVGVGANGTAWCIGANAVPGGFGIYRWQGNDWTSVSGGALRIDVDPQGNAWVVNDAGDVFRFDGGRFVVVPGVKARDVGIGANGAVFVAGKDGSAYKWNNNAWTKHGGSRLTDISVTAQGVPVAIDEERAVWVGQP